MAQLISDDIMSSIKPTVGKFRDDFKYDVIKRFPLQFLRKNSDKNIICQ